MKKFKSVLLVLLLSAFVFDGCKKEGDGSFINLRSRKARLARNWVMVSGNLALTTIPPNATIPYVLSYQFDGSGGNITNSYNYAVGSVKYSLSLDFTKKGRFVVTESLDGKAFSASGRWDFGNGVGDRKKKEDIYIQLEEVRTGDSQEHLFNHLSPEVCYEIEVISKDVLKIHANTNYYMLGTGERGTIESSFTFNSK
jgi:hypothetical protein